MSLISVIAQLGSEPQAIQNTGVWQLLSTASQSIGALLLAAAFIRAAFAYFNGKQQGALRSVAGVLAIGAVLVNLGLLFSMLAGSGNIVTIIVDSIVAITSSGGTTTP